jgi:hypothetical protein
MERVQSTTTTTVLSYFTWLTRGLTLPELLIKNERAYLLSFEHFIDQSPTLWSFLSPEDQKLMCPSRAISTTFLWILSSLSMIEIRPGTSFALNYGGKLRRKLILIAVCENLMLLGATTTTIDLEIIFGWQNFLPGASKLIYTFQSHYLPNTVDFGSKLHMDQLY